MKRDWKLHLLISMAITIVIAIILMQFWHSGLLLFVSWATSFLGGYAYECYQEKRTGRFDKTDLLFNLVGGAFAIPIIMLISMI